MEIGRATQSGCQGGMKTLRTGKVFTSIMNIPKRIKKAGFVGNELQDY